MYPEPRSAIDCVASKTELNCVPTTINWQKMFKQLVLTGYEISWKDTELLTWFSRCYNWKRAKREDPKIINEWFNCVQCTILQDGIEPNDIHDLDGTRSAIGLTATAKVITRSELSSWWAVLQPGNREWVAVIECMGALGWASSPCMIFEGKVCIECHGA